MELTARRGDTAEARRLHAEALGRLPAEALGRLPAEPAAELKPWAERLRQFGGELDKKEK
jgi:hypothetical protein